MVHLPLSEESQPNFVFTPLSAVIMGIVNCTPDSFWRGSRGCGHQGAELALKLVEEGADILDLGAESTRPGAEYIEEGEELGRLLPVIEEIRRHSSIPISVDTRKKNVMEGAWNSGANILNDISALEDDPELGSFVAKRGMPVILMHKRGIPSSMQNDGAYDNVFFQVSTYLHRRAEMALSLGVESDKIWVDPGIGFGKDFEANHSLVRQCGKLCEGKFPVVMALSRKTFVAQMISSRMGGFDSGKFTGNSSIKSELPPPQQRLAGTLAANMMAVAAGASILRVHDVAATKDILLVLESLKSECNGNFR